MKVLLLGDYSNCHVSLAAGLRRLGHFVVVASEGSGWMDTERTINLSRYIRGPLGGALLYAQLLTSRKLQGFDIVALTSPTFVRLKPHRIRKIFNLLKSRNDKIVLTAAGTDKAFVDMVTAVDCPLCYTEYFNVDGSQNMANSANLEHDKLWQQGRLGEFCEYIYDNVDGVMTVLYEYHLAMQRRIPSNKLAYIGIPIDLESVSPIQRSLVQDGKVNFFLGRKREYLDFKGTRILGNIAQIVVKENPDKCRLNIVENIPYRQYMEALRSGDLVLDQLYSYTPATNALLAMAAGQAVVSGAEPEYYDFIGEKSSFPVFNAVPDESRLYELLTDLVNNPDKIIAAGAQGRDFVTKHNDCEIVAQRCLDFWESL